MHPFLYVGIFSAPHISPRFHLFGGHADHRRTPSIFSFIVHTETRNPDFAFALFSSAVKCWTFAPIRMNISPRMRVAVRRHKSFLRYHRRSLLQNVTRRPCKKVPLGVYSILRVGRCYTRREYCNWRVTSGKTGRDRVLLYPRIPRSLGQNHAHYIHATLVTNFCSSKQEYKNKFTSRVDLHLCYNCN